MMASHTRYAVPAGVLVLGIVMGVGAAASAVIGGIWIVFSQEISSAAEELVIGPDSLGVLAYPLLHPLVMGLVVISFALIIVSACVGLVRGHLVSLHVVRVILVVGMIAVTAWAVLFGAWLTRMSAIDPDAPPVFMAWALAAVLITMGVGVAVSILWYLGRPTVSNFFGTDSS